MKQIVIIKALIVKLVFFCLNCIPVLSLNLTVTDPKYVGRSNVHPFEPCVLSAFNVTITVRPLDSKYIGTTFYNLSPETSIASKTECEPHLIQHFYRFNGTFDDKSVNQNMLSVGLEFGESNSVELHVLYMEVLCSNNPNGCLKSNIGYCRSKNLEELKARNCLKSSVSFQLTWLTDGYSYQCSHNSKRNLKDITYVKENPELQATYEVDIHYIRIDKTNSSQNFNPIKYCPLDWILDTGIILIVSSILCLIVILIVVKCLCDCRREKVSRKVSINGHKRQNDMETEKLGPTIEL